MKISVVNEDSLVQEIQSAKKESMGALGLIDSDILAMGVVTKDSGLDKVMIGEKASPRVENVSIPASIPAENKNTVSVENDTKSDLSLGTLKNKMKLKKGIKTSENKKDGKLGLWLNSKQNNL